jgi:tetratricopeptide (TPR) repeat protein
MGLGSHYGEFAFTNPAAETLRFSAVEPTDEQREAMREVRRLLGTGDRTAALAALQQLAESAPDYALPEFARVLRLTGNGVALDGLLATLTTREVTPFARARTLVAAGQLETAIEYLESLDDVKQATSAPAVLLHANMAPADQREAIIAEAIRRTGSTVTAALLFKELFGPDRAVLPDQPELKLRAIDRGLAVLADDRPEIIRLLDPQIIGLQFGNNYFATRDQLLALAPEIGPGAGWFVSRLLRREERFPEALAIIEPLERDNREAPIWPLLAEERADLLRTMGRIAEAGDLYAAIAAAKPSPALVKETARTLLAVHDHARALAELDKIDESALGPDERRQFHVLRLSALARSGNLEAVIDAYPRVTDRAIAEDFPLFHSILFRHLIETFEHRRIEDTIRERFQQNPEATPTILWRLAAAAAAEGNRPPNELEALYNLVKARPGDVIALQALVDRVLPLVKELVEVPDARIAAPAGERERLITIAEEALQELARIQPLDPTAYFALIDLYRARKLDNIPERIINIVAIRSVDSRIIGVAAYSLAIKNFPEDAYHIYRRALEFDPWNYEVKMNYAACLTRLGRWSGALEIYRDALENGYRGRSYHVHEMLGRIWDCYDAQKQSAEAIAYFHRVGPSINPLWREETLRDIGNLLSNKGHVEEGQKFYRRLIEETQRDDIRVEAYENMGGALFHAGRFEEAIAVYTEALARHPDAESAAIGMQIALSECHEQLGRREAAIAELEKVAARWPQSQRALMALVRAAELAALAENSQEERRLLQAFLASNSTNFVTRQMVESRLQEIAG